MFSISIPRSDLDAELRQAIVDGLPIGPETEPHLAAALRQTLDHPGRLIRARLVCEMGRAYGLAPNIARSQAVAIEYFHTASLLFDDLPCMDDATERRGLPCVHRTHGEAVAMLAALSLINRAYARLWRSFADLPESRRSSTGDYVERCLGLTGLVNGQSEDLHYDSASRCSSPQRIAAGKTASLIRLSFVLPALTGGASPLEIRSLERLADFWGLSYQILDDLKDIFQPSSQTGKTAERDRSLNRPNLALAIGPARSFARVERLLGLGDRVLRHLKCRLSSADYLGEVRRRFHHEIRSLQSAALHPVE